MIPNHQILAARDFMPNETNDLPPPVNHIFVDYENVHEVDHTVLGSKTVHLTLLLGARKTKLDATVVEKLLQYSASVEMIRLTSSGKNSLDFALAYYLGRAVLADPCGYFHIISGDGGFDPLIEHLRSKHIRVRRHEGFATLTFSAPSKPPAATPSIAIPVAKPPVPPAPAAPPTTKPSSKPKPTAVGLEELESRVLEHLRKPNTKRPSTKKKLISYLVAHLGRKVTEAEVSNLVRMISQAGHLVIGDKDNVTYHLDQ